MGKVFVSYPIAKQIKGHVSFREALASLLSATVAIERMSAELILPESAIWSYLQEEVDLIMSGDLDAQLDPSEW